MLTRTASTGPVLGYRGSANQLPSGTSGGGGGPTVKGFWWGLPSGPHSADRAMALLPRYFRSRLDATGIDFAHCYTTLGLGLGYAPEDDVRQASLVIAQKVKGDRTAVRQALAEIGVKPVKIEIVKAEYGSDNSKRDVTEMLKKDVGDFSVINLHSSSFNKSFGGVAVPSVSGAGTFFSAANSCLMCSVR